MAKKHKVKGSLIGSVILARVALIMGLAVSAGVGYVWLQQQIFNLTKLHAEKERQLQRQKDYNKSMGETLNALSTPAAVEAQIRRLGLNLVIPAPHQIVRVVDQGLGTSQGAASGSAVLALSPSDSALR
ncbi:MAG: hypothetical protein FJ404_03355 [Verrucomicrobia bacterium]|nr:hypothetical protein [Verrucomicrobiota bacterium]